MLPKNISIFLVDAVGALASAAMLGMVLPAFPTITGLPKSHLFFLAGIAVVFALFSLSNYLFQSPKWKAYLKAISVANHLYCLLTLSLVIINWEQTRPLGIAYFAVEILIILLLSRWEWMVASD